MRQHTSILALWHASFAAFQLYGFPAFTDSFNKSFNRTFNKIDGASFNQITNVTHIVAPSVLENWTNVTAGQSQPGFHVSNLRTKRTLLIRIQVRTS